MVEDFYRAGEQKLAFENRNHLLLDALRVKEEYERIRDESLTENKKSFIFTSTNRSSNSSNTFNTTLNKERNQKGDGQGYLDSRVDIVSSEIQDDNEIELPPPLSVSQRANSFIEQQERKKDSKIKNFVEEWAHPRSHIRDCSYFDSERLSMEIIDNDGSNENIDEIQNYESNSMNKYKNLIAKNCILEVVGQAMKLSPPEEKKTRVEYESQNLNEGTTSNNILTDPKIDRSLHEQQIREQELHQQSQSGDIGFRGGLCIIGLPINTSSPLLSSERLGMPSYSTLIDVHPSEAYFVEGGNHKENNQDQFCNVYRNSSYVEEIVEETIAAEGTLTEWIACHCDAKEDLLHLEDDTLFYSESTGNESGILNYSEDKNSCKETIDMSMADLSDLLCEMSKTKEKDFTQVWDPSDVLMEELVDQLTDHVLERTVGQNILMSSWPQSSIPQHPPRRVAYELSSHFNGSFSSADSSDDSSDEDER